MTWRDVKDICKYVLPWILGIILFFVILLGPARIQNMFASWKTKFSGASWSVIYFNNKGKVIKYWEIQAKSIENEGQSDGIYFRDKNNDIIHLSGNYIYVQVKSSFEQVRKEWNIPV